MENTIIVGVGKTLPLTTCIEGNEVRLFMVVTNIQQNGDIRVTIAGSQDEASQIVEALAA